WGKRKGLAAFAYETGSTSTSRMSTRPEPAPAGAGGGRPAGRPTGWGWPSTTTRASDSRVGAGLVLADAGSYTPGATEISLRFTRDTTWAPLTPEGWAGRGSASRAWDWGASRCRAPPPPPIPSGPPPRRRPWR